MALRVPGSCNQLQTAWLIPSSAFRPTMQISMGRAAFLLLVAVAAALVSGALAERKGLHRSEGAGETQPVYCNEPRSDIYHA